MCVVCAMQADIIEYPVSVYTTHSGSGARMRSLIIIYIYIYCRKGDQNKDRICIYMDEEMPCMKRGQRRANIAS